MSCTDARWYRISNRIANPECESVGNLLNTCGQASERFTYMAAQLHMDSMSINFISKRDLRMFQSMEKG